MYIRSGVENSIAVKNIDYSKMSLSERYKVFKKGNILKFCTD